MKIAYRTFAQKHLVGKTNVPHLKAVRVGDRPAILFSREDLSAGLVGHIHEEQSTPAMRALWEAGEKAVPYEGPP